MTIETLKAQVLRELKTRGVVRVIANYSGGGDNGQFDGITVENAQGETVEFDLDKPVGEEIALGVTRRLLGEEDKKLSDLVEQLAWDAVDEAGHSGFWNNAGGQGQLIIDLTKDEPEVRLEHGNNGEDTREYDEESGEYIGEDEAEVFRTTHVL